MPIQKETASRRNMPHFPRNLVMAFLGPVWDISLRICARRLEQSAIMWCFEKRWVVIQFFAFCDSFRHRKALLAMPQFPWNCRREHADGTRLLHLLYNMPLAGAPHPYTFQLVAKNWLCVRRWKMRLPLCEAGSRNGTCRFPHAVACFISFSLCDSTKHLANTQNMRVQCSQAIINPKSIENLSIGSLSYDF
jgi:hypothetical protein